MAKGARGRRRSIASRRCRSTPYPLTSYTKTESIKNCPKISDKKEDWEDATCSVCMEFPHDAVLLLCSSHDKGCHPYMCGTSFRHSNCLDQYKKAYTKVTCSLNNSEVTELSCPLCRGQVKGWTVVQPAREHLNAKTRTCLHENCSFVGTYKELRKHVKTEHPSSKPPREVDPALEQRWRRMERERENEEVIGTIRSSMPGAVIFGDYVIEGGNRFGVGGGGVNYSDDDDDDDDEGGVLDDAETVRRRNEDRNLMSMFLFLQAFGSDGSNVNRGIRRGDNDGGDGDNDGVSFGARLRRQGTAVLGRSGRRRRRREM
ncbi:hypothetical protein ABFX02_14G094500 [Erythranthe guttata]